MARCLEQALVLVLAATNRLTIRCGRQAGRPWPWSRLWKRGCAHPAHLSNSHMAIRGIFAAQKEPAFEPGGPILPRGPLPASARSPTKSFIAERSAVLPEPGFAR